MKRINTLEELRVERRRLYEYSLRLEDDLRSEFKLLRKDLQPMNLLFGGTKKEIIKHQGGLLSVGAGSLAEFITRNVFLRRSGIFTRLILPAIMSKVASGIVEKNRKKLMGLVNKAVSGISIKRKVNADQEIVEDKRTDEFLS